MKLNKCDDKARDYPADRPPHAHFRELSVRAFHLTERHGVDQRQRRHVSEVIKEKAQNERPDRRQVSRQIEDYGPDQMQHSHDFLRCEVAVCDHADKKRRDHGRDVVHQVRVADLTARKPYMPQVRPQSDEPRAPDKKLKKHHQAQPPVNSPVHPSTSYLLLFAI